MAARGPRPKAQRSFVTRRAHCPQSITAPSTGRNTCRASPIPAAGRLRPHRLRPYRLCIRRPARGSAGTSRARASGKAKQARKPHSVLGNHLSWPWATPRLLAPYLGLGEQRRRPHLSLLRVEFDPFHPLARHGRLSPAVTVWVGVFVPLVLASRRTGVTRYPALWSADFPRSGARPPPAASAR